MFLNGGAHIHGQWDSTWNKLDFACFKKCIFIIQQVVSLVSSQLQFSLLQRTRCRRTLNLELYSARKLKMKTIICII